MSNKIVTALETPTTRRAVMKKAAYVAPAILTLTALPAFASKGSGWGKSSESSWGKSSKSWQYKERGKHYGRDD